MNVPKPGQVVSIDTRKCSEPISHHFIDANARFVRMCKQADAYPLTFAIFITGGVIEYLPFDCIVE